MNSNERESAILEQEEIKSKSMVNDSNALLQALLRTAEKCEYTLCAYNDTYVQT